MGLPVLIALERPVSAPFFALARAISGAGHHRLRRRPRSAPRCAPGHARFRPATSVC